MWKKPPKSADRLPQGWKRHAGETFCAVCWKTKYILRAVSMPIASPLDCTWDELKAGLSAMWASSTQASNWMLTELYARDVKRVDGIEKLPAMAAVYLYPEARKRFPLLPSQSVAALEHAVTAKYRAKRFEVIWTCGASLPSYRYPAPFGIHNQSWSVEIESDWPIISIRMGDRRVRLRLRGGPRFRRQLAALRQMAGGEAERGQMDIYRQGSGTDSRIMVKMVAWLPRKTAGVKEGVLIVRSAPDAILEAVNLKDERIWCYHGDQLIRWIAEHKRVLQHFSDDSKAELRPVPPFARRRRMIVDRFHNRMATATHGIAAMIVGYAHRRRFAGISYDDSDRSFGEGLPWADLSRKIQEKADAAGIEFTAVVRETATTETSPAPVVAS